MPSNKRTSGVLKKEKIALPFGININCTVALNGSDKVNKTVTAKPMN